MIVWELIKRKKKKSVELNLKIGEKYFEKNCTSFLINIRNNCVQKGVRNRNTMSNVDVYIHLKDIYIIHLSLPKPSTNLFPSIRINNTRI